MKSLRTILLGLSVLVQSPLHAISMADVCDDRPLQDGERIESHCQGHLLGGAHALDLAIRGYGHQTLACLPPEATDPRVLHNTVLPYFHQYLSSAPDGHPTVATVVGMMDAYPCDSSSKPGFLAQPLGFTIQDCQMEKKDRYLPPRCAGYMQGAFQMLQASSGQRGTEEITCPSKRQAKKLTAAKLMQLVIQEAIDDPTIQSRSTVSVLAEALAKKYPCR